MILMPQPRRAAAAVARARRGLRPAVQRGVGPGDVRARHDVRARCAVAAVFCWPHRWRYKRWAKAAGRGAARRARHDGQPGGRALPRAWSPPRCSSASGCPGRVRARARARRGRGPVRAGCSRSPARSRCRSARPSLPLLYSVARLLPVPRQWKTVRIADRRVRRRSCSALADQLADRLQHHRASRCCSPVSCCSPRCRTPCRSTRTLVRAGRGASPAQLLDRLQGASTTSCARRPDRLLDP